MLPVLPQALLALADGTVFVGTSIGAAGHTVGEVVFNTSITGYQEILTDPSYCRQIVTLTYPHIGNYGVNGEDIEASKVHAAGLIIKDLPIRASNFRQTQTLSQYLQDQGTVAIANIDTRQLTRLLRTKGAQNGVIIGFRCPNYTQGINVAGYHEHFITDTRNGGGHVLDYQLENGVLTFGTVAKLVIDLPQESDFLRANLSPQNLNNAIRAVES